MIGTTIGNYKITGELAKGGMGAVYRAHHITLPREVVVKSILLSSFPPHLQEQLKTRFLREALVQSQLDHPNIVRVLEFFVTEENYFLVMEFVAGLSLRDLLRRQGRLSPEQALPLFKQALSALDYAHTFTYVDEGGGRYTGITHRDIKPGNFLLDGMARLKLTDFGIVKLATEQGMTRTGFNPGTAEYMSPEQIRGQKVDTRSDLYSLGVTFYEMLAGRLPFPHTDQGSEYEVMRGHIELTPPPLNEIVPALPAPLAAVIMKSLEKDPGARFQTAGEFLQAIMAYERRGITAPQSVRASQPQGTHSMTEVLPVSARPDTNPSTDLTAPRGAQVNAQPTIVTTPAPVQATNAMPPAAVPATNLMPPPVRTADPAPQPSPPAPPALRSTNSTGFFILLAIIGIALIGGAAFFIFQKKVTEAVSTTMTTSSPAPQTQPTKPPTAIEDNRLRLARAAEEKEEYKTAIQQYESYLGENAQSAEAAALRERVVTLKKVAGLLAVAETELNKEDYAAAKRDFEEVLKLRPESKLAQAGILLIENETKK
jgi:serine/threonine-protein kinase